IKITPMLEQYFLLKEQAKEALLFFRMGDFYELFFEDATIASKELQIALTARHSASENKVPMCGVPWHSVEGYITVLLRRGYCVALCEQMENPQDVKGIVKREITRVYTPGTLTEEGVLSEKEHNYLGALLYDDVLQKGVLAWCDISTGKWSGIVHSSYSELLTWVHKMQCKEVLVPDTMKITKENFLDKVNVIFVPNRAYFSIQNAEKAICRAQGITSLSTICLDKEPLLAQACGALLTYLRITQKCDISHLQQFSIVNHNTILLIDDQTENNLEIFKKNNGEKGRGTFFYTIDLTCTPMGARFLEERLKQPWQEKAIIVEMQKAISFFIKNTILRNTIASHLKGIFDIERLTNRVILGRATSKDLLSLKQSLTNIDTIEVFLRETISIFEEKEDVRCDIPKVLLDILDRWDSVKGLSLLLDTALEDPLPSQLTGIGIFKKKYNKELSEAITFAEDSEKVLTQYLEMEKERSGIGKLRIGYTRVFGYYLEVSKSNVHIIPEDFIRKQSLVNAERYTTATLMDIEEKILSSQEERKRIEQELLEDLYKKIRISQPRICLMGSLIATIDYIQSFALVAIKNSWSRPELTMKKELIIEHGRHPVMEELSTSTIFITNSTLLNKDKTLMLLTGPNMGGKSTFLRQNALIIILAQMGSYVPAKFARIGIVDKIFCRVGASDNLAKGQSTFMVEMIETARILHQATSKSFIILDEIGRGTATFDGLAIAWAIVEELVKPLLQARTLFATHYHELTALEKSLNQVFTANFIVREDRGTIVFLHKLVPGPADKSYGIEVAKLAGIPKNVVNRARVLLEELERNNMDKPSIVEEIQFLPGMVQKKSTIKDSKSESVHCIPSEEEKKYTLCIEYLKTIDPNTLTPIEALQCIIDLQKKLS
ncbi:MAG: DNA mismatch repair protein MutS, partial [Desulfovibrionaceae bacterium]